MGKELERTCTEHSEDDQVLSPNVLATHRRQKIKRMLLTAFLSPQNSSVVPVQHCILLQVYFSTPNYHPINNFLAHSLKHPSCG